MHVCGNSENRFFGFLGRGEGVFKSVHRWLKHLAGIGRVLLASARAAWQLSQAGEIK
jgi:hypothetical protein